MSRTSIQPVLLFGAERSGTTLLRLMLDGHSRISWAPEVDILLEEVEVPFTAPSVQDYVARLLRKRIFQDLKITIPKKKNLEAVVQDLILQVRGNSAKEIFGLTLHTSLNSFRALFPSARYIHLVRDPRDVAKSCIEMGWCGNVWTAVERWRKAETEWEEFKAVISPEDFIEIHFEDLISNCEQSLKALCRFLNVQYETALLSYPKHTTYQLPDASKASRWHKNLAPRDRRHIEAQVGSLMDLRGYSREFVAPQVSTLERNYLAVHNRLFRFLFRVKRLGLLLFVFDYLNRRLFLHKLDRWLLPRIHANERRFLR